jgi:hypothetical protein
VRLTADRARSVIVPGYLGEPFIRIGPAGVTVSKRSPTARGARVVAHGRSVVWHDARVRALPPRIERRTWTIPLVVDGRRSRLRGEVWRVDAPSAWPWVLLGLPFLVVVALLLVVRPMNWVRVGAVGFGIAAAGGLVVTGAGFPLDSSASEGRWVEAANELVFSLVGILVVARGKPDTRAIAGGALVLSVLSSNVARVVVALTIAAGAAATCLGLVIFTAALESPEEELP